MARSIWRSGRQGAGTSLVASLEVRLFTHVTTVSGTYETDRDFDCFGIVGEDMQDLFITTASCRDKPELNDQYPQRGDLFKVRVDGIKGVERFKFGN